MKQLLLVTLLLLSNVNSLYAQPLTLENIVSIPDVSNVRLAPNGKNIAYLVRVNTDEHQGVMVRTYNTESEKSDVVMFSNNEKFIITSISWANNETLLMNARFPAHRNGTPTIETRVLIIDLLSKKITPLIPSSVYRKMKYIPNIQSDIIDILPDDDNHVLISLSGFLYGVGETVIRLPINDKGKRKVIQKAKSDITDWITDTNHNVRIAIHRKKATYTIKEKLPKRGFKELWTFEAFSKDSIWPLGFGEDNDVLFVSALYKGRDAIYKVNLKDPELTLSLVHHDENYDVDGRLRHSKDTNKVVGVGYEYWDESYKKLSKMIDEALPDTDNLLLDKSKNGNKYILFASADNEPGYYLIGDKKEKSLKILAYKYEKLLPSLMATKERISYKARDGLSIEGYLTTPKGGKASNLPTIIFPHGGPISYDGSGFDYWTQYFANKGFAVLQMNFRGSSGYGYDFMQQGLASWGQAMQDDVEDGTRWLIKQGIADKNNICIVGASYGGYAALMGGVKTPDLYQCIISFAGVTDVEKLVKSYRKYTNFHVVKKQIGSDYDELWDASPLKHAKKIIKPVLLIHGDKDRVVDYDHSDDMYDELKDEKKVVTYVEIEGADHYLSNNAHRLKAFKAIDKFLDKYLPVH